MQPRSPASTTHATTPDPTASVGGPQNIAPLITLFAAPKAFAGHTAVIQRNAIQSWTCLRPKVEIFLFGDDQGVDEVAQEFSLPHFPRITRNESGTPLLDQIFQQAIDASSAPLMMYTNSDIIYDSTLVDTIERLNELEQTSFLGMGQRIDFDQTTPIDYTRSNWNAELTLRLKEQGQLASILCKDYFIFPQKGYRDIPPFSIGRGNWDNWMVSRAVKNKSPVIDLTGSLQAAHQNHDYSHAGGRLKAYITGPEAKQNQKLAGGTHYVSGSVATHCLTSSGQLKRNGRFPLLTFSRDLPAVMRLVYQLFRQ